MSFILLRLFEDETSTLAPFLLYGARSGERMQLAFVVLHGNPNWKQFLGL
jgi:hypothetical protein